jgi:hypothetical protein
MNRSTPNHGDPQTVALGALAATLADPRRAERLLALTGIGPADLRERAGDPDLLAAVLRFLENHEPDLVEIAQSIGVKPGDLVAVREALEAGLGSP